MSKPLTLAACLFVSACGGTPRSAGHGAAKSPKHELPKELNGSSIRMVVQASMPRLRACYTESTAHKKGLSGKISTAFVIGSEGLVTAAYDVHDAPPGEAARSELEAARATPRFPDVAVTRCLVRTFRSMRFPKPKEGSLTVIYPLVFKAE